MTCLTLKSKVIEISGILNKIIVGIRDPLACGCDPPLKDVAPNINPVYVMEITRKGLTTLLGTFPRMPVTRDDGNTEFLIDPSFHSNPAGLYTGTIKRTYAGLTTVVGPPLTLWLRPPHTHDGAFSDRPGATYGDENPS